MKHSFAKLNEKIFSSKELSGIGSAGRLRLLRGNGSKMLNFLGRCISYTSTRSYGSFLLSFGIVSLLLNLGEYYFRDAPEVSLASLVTSVVLAVLSVPFLLFDKPLAVVVQDIPLTDHIFFEFLSIKRMHRNVKHVTVSPLVALFIGFIPAVVSFFVSLNYVILAILLGAIVLIAMTSPEFSMMLTIIAVPYLPALPSPTLILCCMSALTMLSYGWKVVLGKRVFNFDVYGAIVLLLGIVALISGIISDSDGAFKLSLAFFALILSYFPAANMISNRRLADNAINAVIVSAIPITVLSVIEFIVEHPKTSYVPPKYSTDGISVFFSSPDALAAFMLVAVISTLTFMIEKRNKVKKAFYGVVSILEIAVLGLLLLPEVWLAMVICSIVYPIIKSKHIPIDLLLVIIPLPLLVFFIPRDILDRVSKFFGAEFSFSERMAGYTEAFNVFLENMSFGTGLGSSAYMNSAISDTGGLFNTFLGIATQLGVIALALVMLMIVLRMRHLSYYRLYLRNSLVEVTGEMTAVALIALLSFGMLSNLFGDLTVLYLFWTVIGISAAALRIAKKECDDRQGYYGDSRSSESSALDIGLNY